jgi:hypothetical protein
VVVAAKVQVYRTQPVVTGAWVASAGDLLLQVVSVVPLLQPKSKLAELSVVPEIWRTEKDKAYVAALVSDVVT